MGYFRALLGKCNFLLGRNPKVLHVENYKEFIPETYKSVLIISSDFELAWAWRFAKAYDNPLDTALKMARDERENIPDIINLCERFNIPISWMTVGHLFLESCKKENGKLHLNLPRLKKFENTFWKFDQDDWFNNISCSSYKTSPEWYCPDLIKLIIDSKVKHEIGCHTFSHIDCRDEVCSSEVFLAELHECKKIANDWGIELKSFVHPGHTIGNLENLAEEGFTSYRTDNRNVLGYPIKKLDKFWEFEQTAEFIYRDDWSVEFQVKRYIEIIKRSMKSNTVAVFWFHPSFPKKVINSIWPKVFKFMDENRDKIWITTHGEYTNWLNTKNEK